MAAAVHEARQRVLLNVFGVTEDAGALALILGLGLAGLTFLACCYCKVYDPTRHWCIKKWKKCFEKKPRDPPPPAPDAPKTPERPHWYLNRTLKIDREDRDELGPVGDVKGLQGGWYGARNGRFAV